MKLLQVVKLKKGHLVEQLSVYQKFPDSTYIKYVSNPKTERNLPETQPNYHKTQEILHTNLRQMKFHL